MRITFFGPPECRSKAGNFVGECPIPGCPDLGGNEPTARAMCNALIGRAVVHVAFIGRASIHVAAGMNWLRLLRSLVYAALRSPVLSATAGVVPARRPMRASIDQLPAPAIAISTVDPSSESGNSIPFGAKKPFFR